MANGKPGAPKGNQNAAKAKVWTAAIQRALKKRSVERKAALDELAEKLLEACDQGSLAALQELGNRLEGKPGQAVDISGLIDVGHRLIIKDD